MGGGQTSEGKRCLNGRTQGHKDTRTDTQKYIQRWCPPKNVKIHNVWFGFYQRRVRASFLFAFCISCPQRAALWLNIFQPHIIILKCLSTKFIQQYSSTITNHITKDLQLKSELLGIPIVRPYWVCYFIYVYWYDILSQVSRVIRRCLSLVRWDKLCSSEGWEPPHWLMWGSAPNTGGEVTPCQ